MNKDEALTLYEDKMSFRNLSPKTIKMYKFIVLLFAGCLLVTAYVPTYANKNDPIDACAYLLDENGQPKDIEEYEECIESLDLSINPNGFDWPDFKG